MRRVGPGRLSMVIIWLVCLLFAACGGLAIWELLAGETALWEALASAVLFWGIAGLLACRIIYRGRACLLYDETMAVFVLSRRDRRSCRWEDLDKYGITLHGLGAQKSGLPGMSGLFFAFPDGKQIVIMQLHWGYQAFVQLLCKKRLVRPSKTSGAPDFTDVYDSIFRRRDT